MDKEQENQIRKIAREEIQKSLAMNNFSSFKVQKHIHNGTDVPYIQGVSKLANGPQDVLGLNTSLSQLFNDTNTVYPIPVITDINTQSNVDVDFQGGKAPAGTMLLAYNPNSDNETGVLWICADGTNWVGFISDTGL